MILYFDKDAATQIGHNFVFSQAPSNLLPQLMGNYIRTRTKEEERERDGSQALSPNALLYSIQV